MADRYVDTNVIIRLLTRDDPLKGAEAESLFSHVEQGSLTLAAPDTVIADAVFVLASPHNYNFHRNQIAAMLIPLVKLTNFHVDNRDVVMRALEIYGSVTIDFGDAMIVASMEATGATELYSYDTDFDHFQAIVRNPDLLV